MVILWVILGLRDTSGFGYFGYFGYPLRWGLRSACTPAQQACAEGPVYSCALDSCGLSTPLEYGATRCDCVRMRGWHTCSSDSHGDPLTATAPATARLSTNSTMPLIGTHTQNPFLLLHHSTVLFAFARTSIVISDMK
jgi:hypothetical protein